MTNEEKFAKAIKTLKESERKKTFNQTVDLIINLRNFDVRREAFSLFVPLPHKIKDKKIAGFLESNSKLIDTIKKENFPRYKEKKDFKKLIKQYDFFISNAKLMPAVATHFGRVLGPAGKMPSPQLGVLPSEEEKMIEALVKKINLTVRVRVKEPSIKIAVAKESMSEKEMLENITTAYNKILDTLPKKNENVRSVKLKLTMEKPVNVEM